MAAIQDLIVTPPPVGTVGVGDLMVDAQSRALWLGVSAAVDPNQAILISDIIGVLDQINVAVIDANAYTDERIATRAAVVHTHAIDQVVGLQAALEAAASSSLPAGVILIWSGTIATIPAGFVLCNGQNGTPDLRDRFVLGAGGTRAQGSQGGSFKATGSTATAGGHAHGGQTGSSGLTVAMLPSHTHSVSDSGHVHSVSDPGHRHSYTSALNVGVGVTSGPNTATANNNLTAAAVTGISIAKAFTGIDIGHTGSGAGHTHTIGTDGNHSHAMSNVDVANPYFVLAFIQKLP